MINYLYQLLLMFHNIRVAGIWIDEFKSLKNYKYGKTLSPSSIQLTLLLQTCCPLLINSCSFLSLSSLSISLFQALFHFKLCRILCSAKLTRCCLQWPLCRRVVDIWSVDFLSQKRDFPETSWKVNIESFAWKHYLQSLHNASYYIILIYYCSLNCYKLIIQIW